MESHLSHLFSAAVSEHACADASAHFERWDRFYRFVYALHRTGAEDRPDEQEVSQALIDAFPYRWDWVKELRAVYLRGVEMLDYLFGVAGVERMLADRAAPLGAGQRGQRFHETAPQLAAPENADWDAGPAAAVPNQLKDQGV